MHRLGSALHGSTRAGALLRSLPPPTHLTTSLRVRWNSLREVLALAFGSSATSLYHPAAHTLFAAPWSGCQVRTGQDAALQGRNPAGTPRTAHQPSPHETASLPGPRARGHGGSGNPSPQLFPLPWDPAAPSSRRMLWGLQSRIRFRHCTTCRVPDWRHVQVLPHSCCSAPGSPRRELRFGSISAASYEP